MHDDYDLFGKKGGGWYPIVIVFFHPAPKVCIFFVVFPSSSWIYFGNVEGQNQCSLLSFLVVGDSLRSWLLVTPSFVVVVDSFVLGCW